MGARILNGRQSTGTVAPRQDGFTYIGILIAVALLGISLAAAGTLWSFAAQREKEAELLFIGHQFRTAIAKYRAAGGAGLQYPRELQDLVDDDRSAVPRHFLRKLYHDPMTGADDWNVIRTNDGGIIGVASSSLGVPIKKGHFDLPDASFENAECYCDWKFTFEVRRPHGQQRTP